MGTKTERVTPQKLESFDLQAFLESGGVAGKVVEHRSGAVIYPQGNPCDSVLYIQTGGVKLRVISHAAKEAIVAMLGPGDFFGEGALAGQPVRMATAIATSASAILIVEMQKMIRLLHEQHALSDRFLAHVLARNIRVEADLVDQLFNSSEKRLARAAAAPRPLRQAGDPPPRPAENLPGDARGNGRHDALARELLHEQVQEARLHRVQRRPQDQRLPAEHRPARLTSPALERPDRLEHEPDDQRDRCAHCQDGDWNRQSEHHGSGERRQTAEECPHSVYQSRHSTKPVGASFRTIMTR